MKIYRLSQEKKLTCIIVQGNPQYGGLLAESFYNDIRIICEKHGFLVSMDKGKPHTMPPNADLWICHSRGCGRIRFADKNQEYIAIGTSGTKLKNVINHPNDDLGKIPNKYHFLIPPELERKIVQMKEKLISKKNEDL